MERSDERQQPENVCVSQRKSTCADHAVKNERVGDLPRGISKALFLILVIFKMAMWSTTTRERTEHLLSKHLKQSNLNWGQKCFISPWSRLLLILILSRNVSFVFVSMGYRSVILNPIFIVSYWGRCCIFITCQSPSMKGFRISRSSLWGILGWPWRTIENIFVITQ